MPRTLWYRTNKQTGEQMPCPEECVEARMWSLLCAECLEGGTGSPDSACGTGCRRSAAACDRRAYLSAASPLGPPAHKPLLSALYTNGAVVLR
jgi:hypothetical protein